MHTFASYVRIVMIAVALIIRIVDSGALLFETVTSTLTFVAMERV